jgi:hypothetical protein
LLELYHIRFAEFEEIDIFAKNKTEAAYLVDICLGLNSATNSDYLISDPIGLPPLDTLGHYQLLAAAAQNAEGRAVYDRETGWSIVPLWKLPLTPKPGQKL